MSLATLRAQLRTTFRALQHRNYRLYWTGQLISMTGSALRVVAIPYQIYVLTGSPLAVGLIGLFHTGMSDWVYDPGDLFAGHGISVYVGADRVIGRASL